MKLTKSKHPKCYRTASVREKHFKTQSIVAIFRGTPKFRLAKCKILQVPILRVCILDVNRAVC